MSAHGVGRRDMGASRDAALTRRIQNAFARPHAPRTDPSGPNSGTRLPPWVSDGETFTRPGVKEVRSGEPGIGHLRHPRPCEPVFLAAPPQRAPPQVGHVVAEGHDGTAVRWHRMITKVAADHLPQPAPLDGDRLMHTPPQRVLDPPQGRPHAVGATVPLELEGAPAGPPADVGEPPILALSPSH